MYCLFGSCRSAVGRYHQHSCRTCAFTAPNTVLTTVSQHVAGLWLQMVISACWLFRQTDDSRSLYILLVLWLFYSLTPGLRAGWVTRAKIYKMLGRRLSLTLSVPAVPSCYCLKRSAPYWSNPPVLIFDIRALWRSVRMSKIKTGGLDQYGKIVKS